MSRRKTYIDSGVLIAASRGIDPISFQAIQILDDQNREFASSEFVRLEVLPKPLYEGRQAEVKFYEIFFAKVNYWAEPLDFLVQTAHQYASAYGGYVLDLWVAFRRDVPPERLYNQKQQI